jgi:parvulin-like peptidyl-prolyl isomerase
VAATRLQQVIGWALAVLLLAGGQATGQQPPEIDDFKPELVAYVLNPESKIAEVGAEAIWSHELLPTINQMMEEHEGKAPQSELDKQRVYLISKLLNRHIESKLLYIDFLRSLPPDKQEEVLTGISKQVKEEFYGNHVPRLMEQMKVESLQELEANLNKYGSSIPQQMAQFHEQAIAQSMVGKAVERNPVITHKELLDRYRENIKKYEYPSKARWEKLTVSFEEVPDRAAARQQIAEMGNQVLRGAKFATVAQRFSHGVNRHQGGYHDWTSKDALVSPVLDKAIFTLPINKMSDILEDTTGYHIVRVIERKDAGCTSFEVAQEQLREELQSAKRTSQIREYVEELRRKTRVVTVFDRPEQGVANHVANQPLR